MSRIFFFLLALFSASSQAFTTLDPYMVPAEIRQVNNFVSVDGDTVKVNVMGKGYAAGQPYFNKTVAIPKANFLSWLKGNLKNLIKINPWWIAFAAAMAAAGWAFDELLNMYVKPVNNFYRGLCHPSMVKMSTAECIAIEKNGKNGFQTSGTWFRNTAVFPNTPIYSINFSWCKDLNCNKGWGQVNMVQTADSFETTVEPVSDTSLLDSVFSKFMADPATAAQAMTSPSGYPYDDLFKNADLKYIPGVSEADYPALDCYFRGALQTSNPAGACYATETEYQRVRQIAEQLKSGNTPQGHVDAMNDQLKNPLTQAQLEESLNKLSGADVSKVTDDASKIYDSGFKQLNDSLVANTLPSMPDLVPLPQFQTGSCRSFTINFSLAGVNVTKLFPGESGCAQFEKLKQFLGWFMSISVVIALTFAALREAN